MASIDDALTTLTRAKQYLDISGNTKNSLLTMIILGVSRFVEKTYCRRNFKRQVFTNEEYDGSGLQNIWLKNYPIIQGQTFTMQRRTSVLNENEWETVDTEDYYIDYEKGKIIHVNSNWDEGIKNFRFTYTAGYYLPSNAAFQDGTSDDQDLPYELEMAVHDFISMVFNKRKAAGIQSHSIYQVDITYAKILEESPHLKAILDQYKRLSYK